MTLEFMEVRGTGGCSKCSPFRRLWDMESDSKTALELNPETLLLKDDETAEYAIS